LGRSAKSADCRALGYLTETPYEADTHLLRKDNNQSLQYFYYHQILLFFSFRIEKLVLHWLIPVCGRNMMK
jgi:hypothetical protein